MVLTLLKRKRDKSSEFNQATQLKEVSCKNNWSSVSTSGQVRNYIRIKPEIGRQIPFKKVLIESFTFHSKYKRGLKASVRTSQRILILKLGSCVLPTCVSSEMVTEFVLLVIWICLSFVFVILRQLSSNIHFFLFLS